jgi:hypothetical protein
MDTTEVFAKATIAAALIASHAVEVPTMPRRKAGTPDEAAIRLRELTDYVYQTIAAAKP